jgi:exopolysaccharide production protein ExoZ
MLTDTPSAPRTIWTIQYLRGVAALLVVWHHQQGQVPGISQYLPQLNFGVSGVDLFFVISGFIMVLTTDGKAVTPWQFLRRRLERVVPLYWLLTLTVALLATLKPELFKTTLTPLYHVLGSLFFVPHFSPGHPGIAWPLIVPGWSLNYEMFFYLLFACSLMLPQRWRSASLLVTLFGLVGVGMVFGPFESAAAQVYTRYLMVEFASGMLLAQAWLRGRLVFPLSVAWLMISVGSIMLFFRGEPPLHEYTEVLGATAVVCGALHPSLMRWRSRFWQQLGDASYSIYLTHLFTLGFLRVVWVKMLPGSVTASQAWAFAACSLAVCSIVGILCCRYIEQPLQTLARDLRCGRWLRPNVSR